MLMPSELAVTLLETLAAWLSFLYFLINVYNQSCKRHDYRYTLNYYTRVPTCPKRGFKQSKTVTIGNDALQKRVR